jgi:crotonobetaine/carnitine-CoA ligase
VKLGTCGKVRPGVDVRLVDANDCEVPIGTVGEMMVRTSRPSAMNSGYHKNPEATAKAASGWFHTGESFRCDAEGIFRRRPREGRDPPDAGYLLLRGGSDVTRAPDVRERQRRSACRASLRKTK